MIDTWTFKILIKKIKNLALLFILFWKYKYESHGTIKLLSIIILIFFPANKISTTVKVYKKLFLFKTIILSCEDVDISHQKREREREQIKIKMQFHKNKFIQKN